MESCVAGLSNYADYLSNTPQAAVPMPRPILFNASNASVPCGAEYAPSFESDSMSGVTMPFQTRATIWVPTGWQVEVRRPAALVNVPIVLRFPSQPAPGPTMHFDVSLNRLISVTMIPPEKQNTLGLSVTDEWKYLMCTRRRSTIIGSRFITSYQPGSAECDAFFDTFCAARCPAALRSCAEGSTGANNTCHTECVCLADERDMRCALGISLGTTVGAAGNTGATDLTPILPVACMGKRCSAEGYKWSRMLRQQCNIMLCQQTVDLAGSNIAISGKLELHCGNIRMDAERQNDSTGQTPPGSSPGSPPPTGDPLGDGYVPPEQVTIGSNIPPWGFIVILFGAAITLIGIIGAIISSYRSGRLTRWWNTLAQSNEAV